MASLSIAVKKKNPISSRRISIEVDATKLERLADLLGLYRPEFLQSLDRAESDVKAGRTKIIRSPRDLMR